MTDHDYQKEHEMLKDSVKSLNYAVFGNPETLDMGMKKKVDDLHELLVQAQGFGKILKWTFGAIITIGAAVGAVLELVKTIKK